MGLTFPFITYGYTKLLSLFIKCDHHLISFRQGCRATVMATPRTETQEKELEDGSTVELVP